MPQSLSLIVVHLIFATSKRRRFITPALAPGLHAYLAAVARSVGCEEYRVGGSADHVHLALRLPRTASLAKVVEVLKTSSSRWMSASERVGRDFAWQRGYASFSVGPRSLPGLLRYVDGQEDHHRRESFQDEYRRFLEAYGLDFDERYVWD